MHFTYWDEPFAKTYLSLQGEHPSLRIAESIKSAVQHMPLTVDAEDHFVGDAFYPSIVRYHHGSGISFNQALADQVIKECTDPNVIRQIETLQQAFSNECTINRVYETFDEAQELTGHSKVFWGGGWGGHTLLDYASILSQGTVGLKKRIEKRLCEHCDENQRKFLKSLIVIADALEIWSERYQKELLKMSAIKPDKKQKLLTMAAVLDRVPKNPARGLREALQCFRLVFCFDGIDSPGRFDQYMMPYLTASYQNGELDRKKAFTLMESIWLFFEQVRAWNLCIGGSTPEGDDATNELSYMILDLAKKHKNQAPNLTMRYHDKTPESLWRHALDTIKTGIGMPVLYNDQAVLCALTQYGIPLSDARDYAMNGCNQIDIQGKSNMGLEDGELNLLKCFELAMNCGVCALTNQKYGVSTPDPKTFEHFDELMDSYKQQVEYFTKLLTDAANQSQKVYAEHAPDPFRSLLVSDCIENACEFRAGGARYNHGQVLTEGIANTTDSLAAVKKMVFDDQRITMGELIEALNHNYEGHASLLSFLRNQCPHYGNDEESTDAIACEIIDHFFSTLSRIRTYRGGYYGGGCSTFRRAPAYGKQVAATPDGRLFGESVSDSAGAMQGMDINGPTALMMSVAKIDHCHTLSGYVLNIKFDPHTFSSDDATAKFGDLIKTYFALGGQQVSVNVVDSNVLLDARLNPERHKDLIVRVGGFSAYFTQLEPALQDDVIARTVQTF